MRSLEIVFWKVLPFIPIIIIIVVVGVMVNYHVSKTPVENIKEAVGTVTGYDRGGTSSRSAILAFEANGKIHEAHISEHYTLDEKFMVEFDSIHPEKNRARLDKPVFLEDEETGNAVGYLDTYNTKYFRTITFSYIVDGKLYEQCYEPEEDSESKYPGVKERKKYLVRYSKENPKRSMILLGKPTTAPLFVD